MNARGDRGTSHMLHPPCCKVEWRVARADRNGTAVQACRRLGFSVVSTSVSCHMITGMVDVLCALFEPPSLGLYMKKHSHIYALCNYMIKSGCNKTLLSTTSQHPGSWLQLYEASVYKLCDRRQLLNIPVAV